MDMGKEASGTDRAIGSERPYERRSYLTALGTGNEKATSRRHGQHTSSTPTTLLQNDAPDRGFLVAPRRETGVHRPTGDGCEPNSSAIKDPPTTGTGGGAVGSKEEKTCQTKGRVPKVPHNRARGPRQALFTYWENSTP